MTLPELCMKVGADSLEYLSENNLTKAIGLPEIRYARPVSHGQIS